MSHDRRSRATASGVFKKASYVCAQNPGRCSSIHFLSLLTDHGVYVVINDYFHVFYNYAPYKSGWPSA